MSNYNFTVSFTGILYKDAGIWGLSAEIMPKFKTVRFLREFSNAFYCSEVNKITKLVKTCNFHILHYYKNSNHNKANLMCFMSPVSQTKLTTWHRVLSEKLKSPQLVKKFYTSCGTRIFITAFASGCYLSLSWSKESAEVRVLVKCFVRS
jgi:hypothetical protein